LAACFGYRRGLAAGSTAVGNGTLLAAIEGAKYNGPWDVQDNVRKINGVLRYSQGTTTDGFTLTGMAYSNAWNSTDQVAQRAIDQDIIGRFGTLDPTDGGVSSRFSLSGNLTISRDLAECKMAAMQLGRWDRDAWYWSTPTGQYLVSCMTARGDRRRTINWKQAYNDFSEVADQKKPLYRSQEAEFLVTSGCLDDGNDTLNIALEECWQK
jgi:hypothetical protein